MTTNDRQWAIIAYLTIIGFVFAYFMPKEKSEFLKVHLRQSFALWLIYLVFGQVISNIDSWEYTQIYWFVFGSMFLYGMICAGQGKPKTIPLVGPYIQKILSIL